MAPSSRLTVAGWLADIEPDRCFSPGPSTRVVARELCQHVAALPLVCPHRRIELKVRSQPSGCAPRGWHVAWEGEGEGGAVAGGAFDVDAPAVRLDDAAGDGQP